MAERTARLTPSEEVPLNRERRLAFEVRSQKFGFAVFEGAQLLDWGIRRADSGVTARKIRALVLQYAPDLAVARRVRRVSSSLHDATEGTMQKIRMELRHNAVKLVFVERKRIREFFRACGCRNKHQIASRIALDFPVLETMVPKPRKPWDTEPGATAVFDAVATDIAYLTAIA